MTRLGGGFDLPDPDRLTPEAHPDYNRLEWLSAYEPVARVGESILVSDVSPAGRSP